MYRRKVVLVADSCVGGFGVLNKLDTSFSGSLIYLADYEKNPFGLKSTFEIHKIVESWIKYFSCDYDLVGLVIACNTASIATMNVLSNLSKKYNIKIISMLDIITKSFQLNSNLIVGKRVGLMGTKYTINSKEYEKLISYYKPTDIIPIIATDCERCVSYGNYSTTFGQELIKCELLNYSVNAVETMVLGCTCFHVIKDQISHSLGTNIHFIDPSDSINALFISEFSHLLPNKPQKGLKIYTSKFSKDIHDSIQKSQLLHFNFQYPIIPVSIEGL